MRRVGIIGCGLIGRAWSAIFARAGWDVAVYDADAETRALAPDLIRTSLHDLAAHGLVAEPDTAADHVSVADSLEAAVAEAELVQESGPERLPAKIELFRALDAAAPRSAILASSSSAIVASRFTEDLDGRERCLIAHPANPPHVIPVVELCGAPWTSPDVVKRARDIYDSIGQVTVDVKKEIDGFVLNRMQAVLLSEALRLVGEGYCTAADLDKTIAHGLGLRWSFMGPFETIELNAPEGIAQYCERYGETLFGLSKASVTEHVWGRENIDRIVADWGRAPSAAQILEKSRWRDNRLAALIAHKRAQKAYE